MKRFIPRLQLAVGAFGGELLLLVALPFFSRQYGHEELALLSLGIVAANSGKLLGCLKIDAAITNSSASDINTSHFASIIALAATSASITAIANIISPFISSELFKPSLVNFLCLIFFGGGFQQATTMRSLRENSLGFFALFKSLPSLVFVAIPILFPSLSLIKGYALAYTITLAIAGVWAWRLLLEVKPSTLASRAVENLHSLRTYVTNGAPAAALDSINVLFLSLITISLLGAESVGAAVQLQRIALAPSLAASMLLSQQAWAINVASAASASLLSPYDITRRYSILAGCLSIILIGVLCFNSYAAGFFSIPTEANTSVAVCLLPVLAQLMGSPLTVFFFKARRIHMYVALQVVIFLLITSTYLLAASVTNKLIAQLFVSTLALLYFIACITLSRRSVF